jgi:AmiR/NasT family two-component response regulator
MDESAVAIERLLSVTEANLERRAQLQHALESRVAIEQAKGVLAERLGLDVHEAFQVLRRSARSNRMRLHDLATRVVESRQTPQEIERARLARSSRS